MWADIETEVDMLNFAVVANTAAEWIKESNDEPLSIGVSGGWGVGKSSLVKMIKASLLEAEALLWSLKSLSFPSSITVADLDDSDVTWLYA